MQLICTCTQILGLFLLGSGAMAVAGSSTCSTNFMTASLTVSVVGILLAFEFIAEVCTCCARPVIQPYGLQGNI